MPKTKTPSYDTDKLRTAHAKASADLDTARTNYRDASAALAEAEAFDAAQARVSAMPDAERQALAQAIAAQGLETSEKVGAPAGKA